MHLTKSTQHKLFKAGHYVKGVIYVLMGGFALTTVLGISRSDNGPKEVIDWIGNNPMGQFFLAALAIGLFSYCSWRWYKAIADTEDVGHDKKGSVKRVAWAISGTAYGVLGVYAVNSLMSGSGQSGTKQEVIQYLLNSTWGSILVGLIGLVMAGVGVYQLIRGFKEKYMEDINTSSWSSEKMEIYRTSGKIGHLSRALVYGVIAYFLVRAAMFDDASQFKGLGEAIEVLGNGNLGSVLLALTGTGLFAYGLFMFIKAKYKVI